jgi:hypothetical protein
VEIESTCRIDAHGVPAPGFDGLSQTSAYSPTPFVKKHDKIHAFVWNHNVEYFATSLVYILGAAQFDGKVWL